MCYINVQSGEMHGIFRKKKKQEYANIHLLLVEYHLIFGEISASKINIFSFSETALRNKLMSMSREGC